MKKNGFTLVELLAVISVMVAIILIATPIVMNTIENNRKETAELSMQNVKKAADLYYYNKHLAGGAIKAVEFTCDGRVCSNGTYTLEIDGDVPESGTITIDQKGNVTLDLMIMNGYLCVEEKEVFSCSKTDAR